MRPSKLLLLVGACQYGGYAQSNDHTRNPLSTRIARFEETGTFEQVLKALAVHLRSEDVVVGFVRHSGPDQKVIVDVERASAAQILETMCSQDRRYIIADSHKPHVINVLPSGDDNPRVMSLLNLRVEQLDMVADDWPQNLFMRVPEFSPEVKAYIAQWYARENKLENPVGSPGANMTTNVRPPHLEIHLKGTTVLEILNAVSEWTIARASTNDVSLPQGARNWPEGWKCDALSPQLLPLDGWSRSIFSAFP